MQRAPLTADGDASLLADLALGAGELAMRYFQKSPQSWAKGDSSPVSEADLAVDRFLFEHLTAARPEYGWLSEESAQGATGGDQNRQFIIDPIDGTRGFLSGAEDWCISVAVAEADQPVAAAIYVPTRNELFQAAAGRGTWRNGQPVRCSTKDNLPQARVAGPRNFARRAAQIAEVGEVDARHVHSLAYRFALVADGRVDAAAASANARDWDIAAAALMVKESGAIITSSGGIELRLNNDDTRHSAMSAAPPKLHADFDRIIDQLYGT